MSGRLDDLAWWEAYQSGADPTLLEIKTAWERAAKGEPYDCPSLYNKLVSVLTASHAISCMFQCGRVPMWTKLGASALTIIRRVSTAEQPCCCSIDLQGSPV